MASEICSIQDAKLRRVLIEIFIEMAKLAKYHHPLLMPIRTNFIFPSLLLMPTALLRVQELQHYTISVVSGLSLTAVKWLKRSWEITNFSRSCLPPPTMILSTLCIILCLFVVRIVSYCLHCSGTCGGKTPDINFSAHKLLL